MVKELFKHIESKKLILWDFDGCFCDSERIHFLSYQEAFAAFQHKIKEEEYYHTFTHTGGGAAAEIAKYQLGCHAEEIRVLKNRFYEKRIQQGEAKLFPEIPDILEELQRLGLKSAIASNSIDREIQTILSQEPRPLPLAGVFTPLAGMKKKPAPDVFLHALHSLGFEAHVALIIEDSQRGLEAAKQAGCEAFWIQTTVSKAFQSQAPYLAKLTHHEFLDMLRCELCHVDG